MTANRVVAVASAVIALALAVLPVAANMDWSSTAGVIAGIVAVLGVTLKWLDGWQAHEGRQAPILINRGGASKWHFPPGTEEPEPETAKTRARR